MHKIDAIHKRSDYFKYSESVLGIGKYGI